MLAIPDLHFPWAIDLNPVYAAIEREKPDVVCQLGDLLDQFAHSKYSRTFDLMTPSEELSAGRGLAEAFWLNVRKAGHSKMKMIQLKGNHDVRVEKRIYDKYPEIASLVDLSRLYRFPNVETMDSDKSELLIDGVIYIHGWMTGIGKHANYFNQSVVHGHTHRGSVNFWPRKNTLLFELDCGYLADPKARPLQYGSTMTTQWLHGYGIVDLLGPRFIPLIPRK